MESMLEHLARQEEIAVDSEADSFYSHREKVCLIQVTAEECDYLVDPLADLDLDPLGKVVADPAVTKVFHDAEYDVLLIKRDLGWGFDSLFDTRVAAAALGVTAPGLAAVLKEHFDVDLDKSMQRSNWAQRPLSPRQIAYARLDTRFLLPLKAKLERQLEARGRMMIVEGECRRLAELEPPEVVFRPDDFVKLKGARNLSPIERQVLRELFIARERLSADWDQPPFRVMNNPLLIELARARPRSARKLVEVSGFTHRMLRRVGDAALEAVAEGERKGPLNRLPSVAKKDGTRGLGELEVELFERLKRWRKDLAHQQQIESAYLLNRHVMVSIARLRPDQEQALAQIEGLQPWQLEMFGDELLAVVREFERALSAGELRSRRPWRKGDTVSGA